MPYAVVIAFSAFALVYGAALVGTSLQRRLPEEHRAPESKRVVDAATALVVTLTALVLGLLVNSAKNSYDAIHDKLKLVSADIILLDRQLAQYGPETQPIRAQLRSATGSMLASFWSDTAATPELPQHPMATIEAAAGAILALNPSDNLQRTLQARAIQTSGSINQASWMLIELSNSHTPFIYLVIVVLWLTIVFFSFGLFAPRNATVRTALFLSALCVSAALLLVLELYGPLDGLIRIPDTALRLALDNLGR